MSMENQPSAPQTLKPSSEEDGADNGNNKEWFEAYNFAREICAKQERIDLSRFPTLRAWLSLQGEELRKGRLSRERKILLDNIHKDWQQAHDVSVSVINSSKCDGKKSPQPLQQKPEELYNADIGEGKGKGLSSDCSDNALEKDLEQSGTTASVSVESSAVHVEEKHGDAPTTTSKSESISKTAVAPTTTSVQTAREEEEGPKPPPAATKTKTKTPTEAAAQDSEKATKNNKDTSTDADAEQVPVLPATTTRNSRNIPKDDKLQKAINKIVAAAAAAAVEEEETKRKQLNKDIRSSDAEHVSMLPTTTARNSRNALPTSSTPNNDKPKKAVNNIAAAAAAKQEEMKRKQSTKGSDQSGLSVNKLDLTADNDAPATVTTVAQEDATEKEGPKQRVVENTWTVEKTSSTVVHKKEELMPNQNDATLKANPSSVDSSKPPKEQRCGVIRDKDKHKDRYMRAAGNNAINATGNRNHNRDPPATGPTYWAPTGYPTMPPIPTYYQYPPNAAPGVFPNPYTMYSSSPPFPPTASRPMQRQAQDSNNNNNNNSYRASIAGPRRKSK